MREEGTQTAAIHHSKAETSLPHQSDGWHTFRCVFIIFPSFYYHLTMHVFACFGSWQDGLDGEETG